MKPLRIFLIGNFRDTAVISVNAEPRLWQKGLIRLGHDVQRFSYTNVKEQNIGEKKLFSKRYGTKFADAAMLEQIKIYHPDIVLIMKLGSFSPSLIPAMRQAAPNAFFAGRDGDWYPQKQKGRIEIACQLDMIMASNAGIFLQEYKNREMRLCSFMPNPCDPDIHRFYDVDDKFKTDIIFTGCSGNPEKDSDPLRYKIAKQLSQMSNARVYGSFGNPAIGGLDYCYALSGAKVALSINQINSVTMFHSSRFSHYMASGTFVLAKRVPMTDLLFKDKVHVKYFDTFEEFFDLADYYLKHEKERKEIALAGMQRAHAEFNCVKIAQYFLDLVQKGTYSAPWT